MKRKQNDENELPAPPYGSQSYWEWRYKSHEKIRKLTENKKEKNLDVETTNANVLEDDGLTSKDNTNSSQTNLQNNVANGDTSKVDPKDKRKTNKEDEIIVVTPAEHAWYFTYQELAPLLIPIILGEETQTEEDDDEIIEEEFEDEELEACDPKESSSENDPMDFEENDVNEHNSNDSSEEEEIITNEPPKKYGENDRKSLLEIGCGDVPLGLDFAKEKELHVVQNGVLSEDTEKEINEDENNNKYSNILRRIICCDYSETCIRHLKEKYKKNDDDSKASKNQTCLVPVEYAVHDARNLPYNDKEFDIIFDKGTLDAMLSDKEEGIKNCIQIVAEAGRVLAFNGCFFLVSHLNANSMKGLKWLDDVVVPGLRKAGEEVDWVIECHGSDVNVETADDEGNDRDDKEDDIQKNTERNKGNEEEVNIGIKEENELEDDTKYGPAVYVIRKNDSKEDSKSGNGSPANSTTAKNENNMKTIPLKFFTY